MDELINALIATIEAKNSHDRARSAYGGYSWDYHGHYEIAALDNATDDLENALKEIIREVVREELEAK